MGLSASNYQGFATRPSTPIRKAGQTQLANRLSRGEVFAARMLFVIVGSARGCLDKPVRLAVPVVVVPAQRLAKQRSLCRIYRPVFRLASLLEGIPQTFQIIELSEHCYDLDKCLEIVSW